MTSLWLPGRPLLDSLESDALDELDPPTPPVRDPWTTPTN